MKTIILSLFSVLLSFQVFAQFRKQPYLIYPGQNTRMILLFQMQKTENCSVKWGLTKELPTDSIITSENSAEKNEHIHKVTFDKLIPGSHYFYTVKSKENPAIQISGNFYAAPPESRDVLTFLANGDSRSNPDKRDSVSAAMLKYMEIHNGSQTIMLHSGDFVLKANCEPNWDEEHFNPAFSANMELNRNVPLAACRGNHELYSCELEEDDETSSLFRKYYPFQFVKPECTYFSINYGPAKFIILDQYTEIKPGSEQYNWVVEELERQDKKWIFFLLHAPGYTAGTHKNEPEQKDVQNYIQPLCEMFGVQMIIGGHNHYYAHCVKNGVHHITTGGGGAPLYKVDKKQPYVIYAEKCLEFFAVQINGSTCKAQALRTNLTVMDSMTLTISKPLSAPTFFDIQQKENILQISKVESNDLKSITLYDTGGKIIDNSPKLNQDCFIFEIGKLPKGIYFIKAETKTGKTGVKKTEIK